MVTLNKNVSSSFIQRKRKETYSSAGVAKKKPFFIRWIQGISPSWKNKKNLLLGKKIQPIKSSFSQKVAPMEIELGVISPTGQQKTAKMMVTLPNPKSNTATLAKQIDKKSAQILSQSTSKDQEKKLDIQADTVEFAEGIYGSGGIPNDVVDCIHATQQSFCSVGNVGDAEVTVIAGGFAMVKAKGQWQQARSINDFWGSIKSGFDFTSASLRALGGAISVTVQGIGFAAKKTSSKAMKIAQVHLKAFGCKVGLIRFSLIIINAISDMYTSISFAKGLKDVIGTVDAEKDLSEEQIKAGLDYLVDQLELTDKERSEALQKCEQKKSLEKEEVLEGDYLLSGKDREFCQQNGKFDLLLAKELIQKKKQKEASVIRAAGKEVCDQLKTLISTKKDSKIEQSKWFSNLGKKEIAEAKELFSAVGISTKAIFVKQKGSLARIAVCVLGISLIVIGMVGTGGALGVVAAVGSALLALTYLIQDAQAIWELYEDGTLDSKDKALLALTVGLLVTSLALNFLLPFGTGALIRTGVVEAMWTMVYGYSYMRASRRKRQAGNNNSIQPLPPPTIELVNRKSLASQKDIEVLAV